MMVFRHAAADIFNIHDLPFVASAAAADVFQRRALCAPRQAMLPPLARSAPAVYADAAARCPPRASCCCCAAGVADAGAAAVADVLR